MTGDQKEEREALDRLADALADDILNASDEEILAEIAEDGGEPAEMAAEMRALFERTVLEGSKAKLAAARKAATEANRQSATILKMDKTEARRRYEQLIANDAEMQAKLTMAARKGEGESERDIESAIEDLVELGLLDDDEEGR